MLGIRHLPTPMSKATNENGTLTPQYRLCDIYDDEVPVNEGGSTLNQKISMQTRKRRSGTMRPTCLATQFPPSMEALAATITIATAITITEHSHVLLPNNPRTFSRLVTCPSSNRLANNFGVVLQLIIDFKSRD
ncbi:hypothetical protein PMIN04_003895 [Paraphaeosphaeria minitans]